MAGFVSLASAQIVFQIDFNEQRSSGIDGANYPDPSLTWNEYATPADMTGTLVDTTGAPSLYTISQSGLNDSAYPASNNTGPSWAYDAGDDDSAAVDDFFWTTNTAAATAMVTIGGLGGSSFDLNLVAGGKNHGGYDEQYFSYSLDGGGTWTGFDIYNADGSFDQADSLSNAISGYAAQVGDELVATGLILTAGDSLVIRSLDTASDAAGWNALRLTVDTGSVGAIPEPSALGIFIGLFALGPVLSRRRRRGS